MARRGLSFWDILIYLGLLLLVGWAVFKSLGIIHSPIWVDMIPYYAIGLTGLGAAYKIGKIMNGIERLLGMERRFNKVEQVHNLCINGKLDKSPYK